MLMWTLALGEVAERGGVSGVVREAGAAAENRFWSSASNFAGLD